MQAAELPRLVILDGFTTNPGDLSWAALEALADVTVYPRTSPSEVVARSAGHSLLLTNKAVVAAEAMAQLPDLRGIFVLATGVNIVDTQAAKARGIPVINVPDYATESVAQHTLALLLELTSQVGVHSQAVGRGEWSSSVDFCFTKSPLTELYGKVCGIVGFGRIGRRFASLARCLGMKIWATPTRSVYDQKEGAVNFFPLEHILQGADVVTLHCPLTPETRELINQERLALMKPKALLLNTSRGPLINEPALASALSRGAIGGAGLDVLSCEPPPPENPLLSAPRTVITPHVAWASFEARQRLIELVVENVCAFLAGHPINVVNP